MNKVLMLLGKIFIWPVLAAIKGSFYGVETCEEKDNHVPWTLFFLNISFWAFFWLRINKLISVSENIFIIISVILSVVAVISLYLTDNLPGYHKEDACFFLVFQCMVGALIVIIFCSEWLSGNESHLAIAKNNVFNIYASLVMLFLILRSFVFWRRLKKYY